MSFFLIAMLFQLLTFYLFPVIDFSTNHFFMNYLCIMNQKMANCKLIFGVLGLIILLLIVVINKPMILQAINFQLLEKFTFLNSPCYSVVISLFFPCSFVVISLLFFARFSHLFHNTHPPPDIKMQTIG